MSPAATSTASWASSARRSSSAPTSSRPTRPTTSREYHRVVQVARVPLLLRGGGRVTDEEILERTHAVLEQGAAGIVYGRNVIQHEQPGRDDASADVRRARRRDSRRGARAPAVSVARIGIVGGGLMGRELAAAIGRWAALTDHPVTPRLEAVCDTSPEALAWFERVESVRLLTGDRDELLNDPDLDVLYLAVPHHLHEELYLETIAAGKDFLGEKPFGIDLAAGRRIVAALDDCDRLRPLLERDALLPRRPTRLRHDPLRRARRADRGRARVPALQRPRPRASRSTGSARPSSAARPA